MHLTNASISKNNVNAKKSKAEGGYEIFDNMWHTEDFAGFLADQYGEAKNCKDPLREIVFPQIKEGVITSLVSVSKVLQHRDRSHELYGYDFMVDTNLNVWLLEVNSSPSMEFSTQVTESLVKLMMP